MDDEHKILSFPRPQQPLDGEPIPIKEGIQVTWTWPSTVAFIALLSFIAFVLWLVFG